MSLIPPTDVHLRSYGRSLAPDRHAFAQLVLPLSGELLLDIEGHSGKLDPLHVGFVDTGVWHSQFGDAPNRSIILDLDLGTVAPATRARLRERQFREIGPATRKLVEFMGLMADGGELPPTVLQGWVPLLLDALMLDAPRLRSRLAALLARIEAEPGLPWTTESMASAVNVSVSRLHALFREELDTSPNNWLREHRLARVREWLASTDLPIAELALRAGFSEQSALTRAMRKASGLTPAAYRRQSRENGSNPQ